MAFLRVCFFIAIFIFFFWPFVSLAVELGGGGESYDTEAASALSCSAMAALMNKKTFLEVVKNKKRTITYVIPDGPTIQVTEGSKRQLALKEKYGY